jgi:hypothetical protein
VGCTTLLFWRVADHRFHRFHRLHRSAAGRASATNGPQTAVGRRRVQVQSKGEKPATGQMCKTVEARQAAKATAIVCARARTRREGRQHSQKGEGCSSRNGKGRVERARHAPRQHSAPDVEPAPCSSPAFAVLRTRHDNASDLTAPCQHSIPSSVNDRLIRNQVVCTDIARLFAASMDCGPTADLG